MIELILTRQTVIALGVAAAALVVFGTWLRVYRGESRKRIASFCINLGYVFLGLSILIYLILGFR